MSNYLKIFYPCRADISYCKGLKMSITYIGKHYGKLANKKDYPDKKYLKYGIEFIAKQLGRFFVTPVRLMIEPKRIKGSNNKQWRYNKLTYGKAYGYIIHYLLKSHTSDKDNVEELLNMLYNDVCKDSEQNSELERICSNAILFWQKEMLNLHHSNPNVSINNREDAGKILKEIKHFDRPIPQTT